MSVVGAVMTGPGLRYRVNEADFVKESKVMLDFIEKLKRGEQVMQAAAAPPQQTGFGGPAPRVRSLLSYVYST